MIVIKFFSKYDYEAARRYLADDTNYKFNEFSDDCAVDVFGITERAASDIANAFGGTVVGTFAYRDGDGSLVTLN